MPIRLSFPGFTQQNANPDLGDSAIVESVGSGGFSLAESPALVKLVGGSVADTITYSREDVRHYGNAQPAMSLPSLDFAGLPIGIDVRKVAHTGIRPLIITGIVHKQARGWTNRGRDRSRSDSSGSAEHRADPKRHRTMNIHVPN